MSSEPILLSSVSSTAASASTPEKTNVVDIHDRIMDAYYGRMGEDFMRKTQERIHWVCGNVDGVSILDVGCSQGIGPILLGREGKRVIGVDSDPDAVDAARKHLITEPRHVQEKVQFILGDFLSLDLQGQSFDTVVMSEVLEHLVNPRSFIAAAARQLRPGGRLIVTVPFGINDFIDHKRTYYLLEPYRLIASCFDIDSIKIFGRWIGFVARCREEPINLADVRSLDVSLLAHFEAALLENERASVDQIVDLRRKLDDANKKYRSSGEHITSLKQKVSQEEQSRTAAAARVTDLQARFDAITATRTAELKTRDEQIQSLSSNLKQQTELVRAAEKASSKYDANLDSLRSQLDSANLKYRESTQRYADLKEKLGQQDAARQAASVRSAELQGELDALHRAANAEREQHAQQLTTLQSALREQQDGANTLRQQLARSESSQAGLQAQLDAAAARHQETAAIQARLEDKLGRYEAERLDAVGRLAQLQAQLESAQTTLHSSQALVQEERGSRQARSEELERELLTRAEAVFEAQKQIIRAETTIEGVRAQLDAANAKYRDVTARYGELAERQKTEAAAHREAVQQHGQAQGKLTANNQALETQADQLREQIAAREKELIQQREFQQLLREQLAQAEAGSAGLKARLVAAEQQAATAATHAQALLAASERQAATALAQAEARLAAVGQQAADDEAQADARLNAAERQAEARLAAADKQAEVRVAAIEQQAQARHAESRQTELALQGQLDRAEQRVAELRGQLEATQAQSAQTGTRLAELDAALSAERAKLYAAQLELAERTGRLVVLQQALDVGRADLGNLQLELRQHDGARQALVSQLGLAQAEAGELRRQFGAAQTELDTLRQTHAALQAEHAARVAEAAANQQALQQQIEQHRAAVEAARSEVVASGLIVQGLRQQLTALQQTLTDARSQHASDVSALQADHARNLANIQTRHTSEIQGIHARQQSDIDALQRDHAAVVAAADQAAALALAQVQVEAQDRHLANLQVLRTEHAADLAETQAFQRAGLQTLRNEHAIALADAQARQQADHDALRDSYAASLADAVAHHEAALQDVRDLHERETIGLLARHREELQQATQHEAAALTALSLQHEATLGDAHRQHAAVAAHLDAEHRQALARQIELHASAEALRSDLDVANLKYRDVTGRYGEMREQLRLQEVARQASDSTLEQNKIDLLRSRHALAAAHREVERLKTLKSQAENQVTRTRAMVSFQVGYAIVHGFKSPGAMLKLPKSLWNIYRSHQGHKRSSAESSDLKVSSTVIARGLGGASTGASVNRIVLPRITGTSLPAGDDVQLLPAVAAGQRLKALKVAAIMDEFTYMSYAPECNLLQLTPSLFRTELDGFKPDLLFIESAWRGKDDLWGSKVGHLAQEVQDILAWCREHKVPTVFWNKEDPIHFETFLTTARLFDHVFTTDIDCIHRYKAALGHERVYLLPFAAQPALSNPIEKYQRKDAFCFAGAYYVRYPERTRDLGNFVSQLADYKPVEIYDRNYGKEDVNYKFPPEYQPFIVGNLPFDQIDKAYKGYNYAINLNSIKQSQSMFARRVFELLASNTITVSNFSRGVRLMFGDLVITTDSGEEIVRRLKNLCADDTRLRKFRLAALRKVMSEHTYQDRFGYLVAKVQSSDRINLFPMVVMIAHAKDTEQYRSVVTMFERQTHREKRLIVVVPNEFKPMQESIGGAIELKASHEVDDLNLSDLCGDEVFIAGVAPDDYYGCNYLTDLAIATRYTQSRSIGKGAYYVRTQGGEIKLSYPTRAYHTTQKLPVRSTIIHVSQIGGLAVKEWLNSIYHEDYDLHGQLCIDEFNYCRNGNQDAEVSKVVDDLPGLNLGCSIEEYHSLAENIKALVEVEDNAPAIAGKNVATWFNAPAGRLWNCGPDDGSGWRFNSSLADGKLEYFYASRDLTLADLGFSNGRMEYYFEVEPGLNLQFVLMFLDGNKQRISSVVKGANRNQEIDAPIGAEWVRPGIRIYGSGSASVKRLFLGHRSLQPAEVIGRSNMLVVTNNYPSYDELYRNAFVHSRVVSYRKHGVNVDVFRYRQEEGLSFQEFQDIDVITGETSALKCVFESGRHRSILVHFLDEPLWSLLESIDESIQIIIWLHGAEVQPWHRRACLYETPEELAGAKERSARRMAFWKEVFEVERRNFKFVFVSQQFADTAMADVGVKLSKDKYSVINNPIDIDLFQYAEKHANARKAVLSVRPFASKIYANDLTVAAIKKLQEKPWFGEMRFKIIGDGKLFEETVRPLIGLPNVEIQRGFLTQAQIAAQHREFGVFLSPSRMDTQGVSRDEAMASGLVPVTTNVAAIPEFVNRECGYLGAPESVDDIVAAIAEIYDDPEGYLRKSFASAMSVRSSRSTEIVIRKELDLFAGDRSA